MIFCGHGSLPQRYRAVIAWCLACVTVCAVNAASGADAAAKSGPRSIVAATRMGYLPSLKLAGQRSQATPPSSIPREVPRGKRPPPTRAAPEPADPVIQRTHPRGAMPEPRITFAGVDNLDSVAPSDSCGDVGLSQYLAMVNMHFCIYDKATGQPLVEPMLMSSLFAAAGFSPPASTTDDGDPVVLYDHLAGRWFISQFVVSVTPCHEVIGISATEDATGGWYLYDFVMPNDKMNDYPKFGVWPDGYYMTDNQFNPDNSWGGAGVFVFDRAKMLVGDPSATYQYFDLSVANPDFGSLLPADLDGTPPPDGAPNLLMMVDSNVINPISALYIWEFHVDWANPAGSRVGNNLLPNYTVEVAAFNWTFPNEPRTVPQPGVSQRLDPLSDRLMHRLQYRNFGTRETLVVCHTVNVGNDDQAGVRYYELQRTEPGTFTVREQATFAPDGHSRWMGSAALDGLGNLAVGYSISSSTLFPSLRYAGRLANDPLGGLFQDEASILEGTASQTNSYRWGDYSAMSVDPADDSTFWYIGQYTAGSRLWKTHIGAFQITPPIHGTLTGTITNAVTGAPVAKARVGNAAKTRATVTNSQGQFFLMCAPGTDDFQVSATNYESFTASAEIVLDGTTTVAWALPPVPLVVTPADGLSSSGPMGGPFLPAAKSYVLTNQTAAPFTWTAEWSGTWLDVQPAGGELAALSTVTVTVSYALAAQFLHAGLYTDTLSFATPAMRAACHRSIQLTVGTVEFYREEFAAGLPTGWEVINHAEGSNGWVFANPCGRENMTGGTGTFVIVDSDCEGEVDIDSELRTQSFDLRHRESVSLAFNTDFRYYDGGIGAVEVSANGTDGPWTRLREFTEDVRGPTDIVLALGGAANGANSVTVRFLYQGRNDWWWQVDNVRLLGDPQQGDLEILPLADLTATGYVGEMPVPAQRVYQLKNQSVADVTWTGEPAAAWLEVTPTGGTLAPGATVLVTVGFAPAVATLPAGARETAVTFANTTASVTQSRTVRLTVLEPLSLAPAEPLRFRGLEGGPFAAVSAANHWVLTNSSHTAVSWTAAWTADWLTVSPATGTLAGQLPQALAAGFVTAKLLIPGVYEDDVVITNTVTGASFTGKIAVEVVRINGKIGVADSVAPADDLSIPFGSVPGGGERVERITVANVATNGRNLTVNALSLGYYRKDFADGNAAGWSPSPPAAWTVAGGAYQAVYDGLAAPGFMQSVYTPQTWTDSSFQADVGLNQSSARPFGVALRCSNTAGDGYWFLINGDEYSVFIRLNGNAYSLQGWTLSPAIHADGTNTLCASAQGEHLRLLINGVQVWDGQDSVLASGHAALVAYGKDPTLVFAFNHISVSRPVTQILGVGRKQRYLNAARQEKSDPRGPELLTRGGNGPTATTPAGRDAGNSIQYGVYTEPFRLPNLPAVPIVLAPGASFSFTVAYAPTSPGAQENVVSIYSDDNDTDQVRVALAGRAPYGTVTGTVTSSLTGLPLAGTEVLFRASDDNSRTVLTGANGTYSTTLLVGTYSATVTQTSYAGVDAGGIEIQDQATVERDFTLAPVPTALSAVDIHPDRFTARWTALAGATDYRLDVSPTESFAEFVGGFNDYSVGNVSSCLVPGLTDGTTYYYRVRATGTVGASANSAIIKVPIGANTPYATYEPASGVASAGSSDGFDLTTLFHGDGMTYAVVANSNPALVVATVTGANLTLNYADGSGAARITVRVTDANGFWVETTITVTVTAAPGTTVGPMVLNRQTGLFEQTVTVTNNSPTLAARAVTLTMTALSAGVTVYNATGQDEAGHSTLQWRGTLDPSAARDFVVQYYTAQRGVMPAATIQASLSLEDRPLTIHGVALAINGSPKLIGGTASFLIEFTAVPGRTYYIQYTDSLAGEWKTVQPPIVAPVNKVQWVDSGPPATESAPGSVPARYYRVIEVTP